MVVQHNMQALNANRMLGITQGLQAKSTEKLASGYQINRAADDAAGLSISEKMRKQIRGLDQASTNAQDGISAVQTAEGALTEVHSMLQRMNELAVQASNGTNSETDRQSIQDEIDQLTTEIDRVAETTKFNETYLLKGNGKVSTLTVAAKDAGIEGSLKGVGTGTATFTMDALKEGQQITIGSKGYTIGTSISTVKGEIAAGNTVTINGKEYKVVNDTDASIDNVTTFGETDVKSFVNEGAKVVVGTYSYVAATMQNGITTAAAADGGVGKNDASIISKEEAYALIGQELAKASSVGADPGKEAKILFNNNPVTNWTDEGNFLTKNATKNTVSFSIKEAQTETTQGLQFSLHVGADADENNKIAVTIDTMDAAGLGVAGLNIVDNTGAKATYAIDAIADAVSKVSATRSALGAVQNRLEHTIANLDNVVENTTSAESAIRDTDMAAEMVNYSKNNILAQAGQAMLAQANTSTQGVLSLLG